jgi:alkanesulfonate monooxygenase SsuD/methylene tetrahydromethanopterin reductase-like flavin-dependent oxidoreductase (luciferase family)
MGGRRCEPHPIRRGVVSCIYYHSAFMLARQAADVDRISGGRLVLRVGIGDDVQAA